MSSPHLLKALELQRIMRKKDLVLDKLIKEYHKKTTDTNYQTMLDEVITNLTNERDTLLCRIYFIYDSKPSRLQW